MAKVTGVKEKLHMPLYDAFVVPRPNRQPPGNFAASMLDPRMIRFFVDTQDKTKLETNLQASGALPSQNRYEARALRVVTADLNPALISDLIYHSVTTLLVGEKIMVEAPTYLFPSGLGSALETQQSRTTGNRIRSRHSDSPRPWPSNHSRTSGLRCSFHKASRVR
jgi:hypothetical protein